MISEMLLPLHCVINKSVYLPTQAVQERQNMESRCLLGLHPTLASTVSTACPLFQSTHHMLPKKVMKFPFVPPLPPALGWRHIWGFGVGIVPVAAALLVLWKAGAVSSWTPSKWLPPLSTHRPCSAVKMPRAEIYLAKSFLLVWALCYTVREETWTFTVRLVSKTCD